MDGWMTGALGHMCAHTSLSRLFNKHMFHSVHCVIFHQSNDRVYIII